MGGLLFMAGMIVGGGAGLLLAPASGANTRRRLRAAADDWKEEIGDLASDARSKVKQAIGHGGRMVV
jgi:gas vesicle protein